MTNKEFLNKEFLIEMQDTRQVGDELMMATMAYLGKKFVAKVRIVDIKAFAALGDMAAVVK